ncbi:MAG: hypothetical protein OCD02_13105 [Spirochaetaceae bacterium]
MSFKNIRWVIIVAFFVLSIINVWFGLLGFICMGLPIYQAARGRGKIHCKSHCPRGSFLSKIVSKVSLRNSMPKFLLSKKVKNIIIILMITMLTLSIIHAGADPKKIAFSVFRLMGISFVFGIVMGIYYKPKSWCAICPMGHGTTLITNLKVRNKVKRSKSFRPNKKSA